MVKAHGRQKRPNVRSRRQFPVVSSSEHSLHLRLTGDPINGCNGSQNGQLLGIAILGQCINQLSDTNAFILLLSISKRDTTVRALDPTESTSKSITKSTGPEASPTAETPPSDLPPEGTAWTSVSLGT